MLVLEKFGLPNVHWCRSCNRFYLLEHDYKTHKYNIHRRIACNTCSLKYRIGTQHSCDITNSHGHNSVAANGNGTIECVENDHMDISTPTPTDDNNNNNDNTSSDRDGNDISTNVNGQVNLDPNPDFPEAMDTSLSNDNESFAVANETVESYANENETADNENENEEPVIDETITNGQDQISCTIDEPDVTEMEVDLPVSNNSVDELITTEQVLSSDHPDPESGSIVTADGEAGVAEDSTAFDEQNSMFDPMSAIFDHYEEVIEATGTINVPAEPQLVEGEEDISAGSAQLESDTSSHSLPYLQQENGADDNNVMGVKPTLNLTSSHEVIEKTPRILVTRNPTSSTSTSVVATVQAHIDVPELTTNAAAEQQVTNNSASAKCEMLNLKRVKELCENESKQLEASQHENEDSNLLEDTLSHEQDPIPIVLEQQTLDSSEMSDQSDYNHIALNSIRAPVAESEGNRGSCRKYFRSDSITSGSPSTPSSSPLTSRIASSSSSPIIGSNEEPWKVQGINLALANTERSKIKPMVLLEKFTESENEHIREVIADRPLELATGGVTPQSEPELLNPRVIEQAEPVQSTWSTVAPRKPKRKVALISNWVTQKKKRKPKCTFCSKQSQIPAKNLRGVETLKRCKDCDSKFNLKILHIKRKFVCSDCQLSFDGRTALINHFYEHTDLPKIIKQEPATPRINKRKQTASIVANASDEDEYTRNARLEVEAPDTSSASTRRKSLRNKTAVTYKEPPIKAKK